MNAFILLFPLLCIRYGLPVFFDKTALIRASHYPSFPKNKQKFLFLYQLSTLMLLIIPFFLKIRFNSWFTYIGSFVYFLGIIFLIISTINFSKPNSQNMNLNGLYKFSRNPMYIGYFVYFCGCVLITKSILLFVTLIIFQVSCHWLILAEEKWCIEHFGIPYKDYMKKVRRYF